MGQEFFGGAAVPGEGGKAAADGENAGCVIAELGEAMGADLLLEAAGDQGVEERHVVAGGGEHGEEVFPVMAGSNYITITFVSFAK